MTRPAFCFSCREQRVFYKNAHGVWECPRCGITRTLSINVEERHDAGSLAARFWGNVKVTDFCWPWITPSHNKVGGPRFSVNGKCTKIGRAAFFFSRGEWPKGVAVRVCTNELCCRPGHIVDIKTDGISKLLSEQGRLKNIKQRPRLLCRRGHALRGKNKATHAAGNYCRKCQNKMKNIRYHRRKYGREDLAVPAHA